MTYHRVIGGLMHGRMESSPPPGYRERLVYLREDPVVIYVPNDLDGFEADREWNRWVQESPTRSTG